MCLRQNVFSPTPSSDFGELGFRVFRRSPDGSPMGVFECILSLRTHSNGFICQIVIPSRGGRAGVRYLEVSIVDDE